MAAVPKSVELPGRLTTPYVEQGDPAGRPLVFVHAIGDSWRVFEPILEHLPGWVHAFAPSQRGHGEASRPGSGFHPRDFAVDLANFMDALCLGPAVVVGASSGGFVARRFAIDHPQRTRGLVLLGAPAQLRDKAVVVDMWESTVSKLADPIDPQFVRGFGEGAVFDRVPADVVETLVEESLKVPAHVWKQTYLGLMEDDSLAELHRITTPTLILWGDKDGVLPRGDQDVLVNRIRGSRLVVYEGARHMFYLEEPERVAHDLCMFLEGLPD